MKIAQLKIKAQEEWAYLQASIDKEGGLVLPGLYHGKRRVRAKLGLRGLRKGWLIAASEIDLISAIETDFISEDVNKIDLLRKTGLKIRDEVAPVKLVGGKDNYPDIERVDEWGEKSRLYIDNCPMFDRLFGQLSIINVILILIFWPIFVSMLISDNISLRANQMAVLILFIIMPGIVCFLGSGDCMILCGYGWLVQGILAIILVIYNFIIFFPFLHHACNDKPL